MSTSAGSLLSFLRSRARRRGRAGIPAEPGRPHPQSWGPGLATLVRLPARPVSARPAAPTRVGPRVPPEPTVLARAMPGPSSLTPAATIATVAVPVIAGPAPTRAVPGLAVPDEGAETTVLPSRQDAPGTTINPRRVR